MAANTAWLCITDLGLDGVKAVYLIEEIEEPQQPEVKMGDVNGDGTLTVSDASLLINYLLNTLDEEGAKGDSEDEELPVINTTAADLNNDDVLNITDLTLLLNILLNTV